MNRIKALLAVILPASMLTLSSPASAQGQSDVGWYIGGSYGMTSFDIGGVPAGISVDDSDSGFKIFGGFQFSRHWGAEVGYVDFGKATIGDFGDIGVTALTFAGTGTLPLNESFSLLGKVGMAMWDASGSASSGNDGTDLFYGIGARYNFNKNLSVQVEYEILDTDNDSVNMTSVGLRYKF